MRHWQPKFCSWYPIRRGANNQGPRRVARSPGGGHPVQPVHVLRGYHDILRSIQVARECFWFRLSTSKFEDFGESPILRAFSYLFQSASSTFSFLCWEILVTLCFNACMVLRLGCSRWRALHFMHSGTLFARPNTHKSRKSIRRGNYISLDCPATCIARCYCPGGQAATEAQCPFPLNERPALHVASTPELQEFIIEARESNSAAVQEGRLAGTDAPTIDDLNVW